METKDVESFVCRFERIARAFEMFSLSKGHATWRALLA